MKTSQTITKIASALLKAQGAMGTAIKDAKNPFFKSKYADLNSIREACMPSLQANGITLLQPTITIDGKNYVETILIHESGEWMSCETEILFGKKDDAQAQGSGITYARRYGMQSFLNVGADDDDGNIASQPKQVAKPFLERGTVDFTNVTNALLQGKATIEDVKKKFQLLEPMENELTNLKVKK
jgi:hypothetical protein